LSRLADTAVEYAAKLGLPLRSPADRSVRSSITAVHVDQASLMERKLRELGIIVSARNDVLRIAPHFYNTEDDIVRAMDAISYLSKNQ